MATTLYFMRHGETDWNRAGRFQGHTDIPLSRSGRQQAMALARRAAALAMAAIYTSDLSRAADTARLVAAAHPACPEVIGDARLREFHVGRVAGLTAAEIRRQEPAFYEHLHRQGSGAVGYPGGESPEEVLERVLAAVTAIRARHAGTGVGVVTHGGVIKLVAAHVLGLPADRRSRIRLMNCSLTCVLWPQQGPPLLHFLNDFSHLTDVDEVRVTI